VLGADRTRAKVALPQAIWAGIFLPVSFLRWWITAWVAALVSRGWFTRWRDIGGTVSGNRMVIEAGDEASPFGPHRWHFSSDRGGAAGTGRAAVGRVEL